MCGIAGFYNFITEAEPLREQLNSVLRSIRHRGPDNTGIYMNKALAMGNVRLAILGLDQTGNQPVYNEDKTAVVVFNGEIYNYPEIKAELESKGHCFYTHTDTEILVHLYEEYGTGMAEKLNGMFAFAIYDVNKKILLIGRDRTAQKPLYYTLNEDGIFFCSELKAMLPFLKQRRLNKTAILPFLQMGYCLEPQTIIDGVLTLEPGSLLSITNKTVKTEKFFKPAFRSVQDRLTEGEWLDAIDDVMRRAVKRHQLSDVPISVFLSGGIDSSLIAQYLAENGLIKKAYTASFSDEPDFDEYTYASKLASICGFDPIRVELSKKILADNIEDFLETSSMPPGDTSALPMYCLSKEVAKNFKVVLGGDGGDELFGGYPTYIYPFLKKHFGFIPSILIKAAHRFSAALQNRNGYMTLPFKLQQLSFAWGKPVPHAHFYIKSYIPPSFENMILHDELLNAAYSPEQIFSSYFTEAGLHASDVDRLCWIDFNTFLRSCTIPKAERNCMRFSLENRLPFLDNEVLDLSFRTPVSMKVNKHKAKIGLKKLLTRKLENKSCFNPRKQGFSPPLRSMLQNELRAWADATMHLDNTIFNQNMISYLDNMEKVGFDLHRLKWNICALLDWTKRNKISL